MLNADLTGDNSPTFAASGLIDSPTLEADAAENRRALLMDELGEFDPLGLYQLEQSKDEAITVLADAFPAATVLLHHSTDYIRLGEWKAESHWSALVQSPAGEFHAIAATPIDAVNAVIKAYRKATAIVRTTPEHREINSFDGESFGRIDPSTKGLLLTLADEHCGRSDFLAIDDTGKVTLADGVGRIDGSEAQDIGRLVGMHVRNCTPGAAEAERHIQTLVMQKGNLFKAYLVTDGVARVEIPGAYTTRGAAFEAAKLEIANRRSTIAPAVARQINVA